MITTLILGNGIELSAPLDEQRGRELLQCFLARIDAQAKAASTAVIPPIEPPFQQVDNAAPVEIKLVVYRCDACVRTYTKKTTGTIGIGNFLTCDCGHTIKIESLKKASGDCPECGTTFYNKAMLNGLTELQCGHCKKSIELVELPDGTLTGAHNVR